MRAARKTCLFKFPQNSHNMSGIPSITVATEKPRTMALPLEQRKKLIAVIQGLFTSLDDLTTFIRDNTGRNVQEIVVGNLYVTRSQLVTNAESREWVAELIEALKDVAGSEARATLESIDVKGSFAKPQVESLRAAMQQALTTDDLLLILKDTLGKEVAAGNIDSALANAHFVVLAKAVRGQSGNKSELRKPLEELGLLTPTPSNLEKIVNDANSFLNLGIWLRRLTDIEGYVCRIAVDGPSGLKAKGSGFLVGPSTVLTNHHVVASALSKQIDPKRLRVQFDYRVLQDGSTDAGTIVELDHSQTDSWRIGFAPHSAIDTRGHPLEEEPEPEALDYALLRLTIPIGAMPIGAVAGDASTLPKRGWMDLEAHGETSKPNSAVFNRAASLGIADQARTRH